MTTNTLVTVATLAAICNIEEEDFCFYDFLAEEYEQTPDDYQPNEMDNPREVLLLTLHKSEVVDGTDWMMWEEGLDTWDTDYYGRLYIEIPEVFGVRFTFSEHHNEWFADVSGETAICLDIDADEYHSYRLPLSTYLEKTSTEFDTTLPSIHDVLDSSAMGEETWERMNEVWEDWVKDEVVSCLPEYVRDFCDTFGLDIRDILDDIYNSGDVDITYDGGYFNMTLHVNGRWNGSQGIADKMEDEIEFWIDDNSPDRLEDWHAAQNGEY